MLNRFQGPSGERITKDILQRQRLLGGNSDIVEAVYKAASLKEFQPGETVIAAGAEETDIYFILTGEVSIEVHERLVATRGAACHLGEISLVNPALARTATVRAVEKTVCAVVSEPAFSAIADEFPVLWRTIAIELSERLNERKKFHSPPNETPNLFIACSSEMLPIAQHIQLALSKKPMLTQIWTDSFFRASKTTIESLLDGFHDFDFAIIILGPDDIVISREQEDSAPRDNVVFELGLAMGALSRERTFLVYEHKLDIKIPSDLLGVTPLTYTAGTQGTLAVRLASVATQIQIEVEAKGPK